MSAITFPPNAEFPNPPQEGDTFTASNGVIYTWQDGGWMANQVSGLDDTYVNRKGDDMTGDLTIPSLNSGPLAGFRNQLINGAFSIWQRGTAGVGSAGQGGVLDYTADRWGIYSNANPKPPSGGQSTTVPSNGEFPFSISLTSEVGSLQQRVEIGTNNLFLAGTTWTFSCYATGALKILANGEQTQLEAQGTADAAGFQRYTLTWTLSTSAVPNANGLSFGVPLFPQVDLLLTGCQLELGSVATKFEHRPIATELALCQRYFIRKNVSYREVGVIRGYRSASGNGVTKFTIPYLNWTNMRTAPTVSCEDMGGKVDIYSSPNTNSTTTYSFNSSQGGAAFLIAAGDGAAGYVAVSCSYAPTSGTYGQEPGYINQTMGSYFDLDAEL